jgi:hypothetical protein
MAYFPKPKDIEREPEAVHVKPDGTEQCNLATAQGREEYLLRKYIAWVRQGKVCYLCHQPLAWRDVTADHWQPRGMGGARRDDRQGNIRAAHWLCNQKKGSRRIG